MQALVGGQGFVEIGQRGHFGVQGDGFGVGQGQAVLGFGQKQHVRHHAGQALEFFGVGGQGVAVVVRRAFLRQGDLRLGQQVADGGAQLVRQVGRKGRQALEVGLQAQQHVVQALGQVGHLHRHGIHRHAFVQPVGAHGLGAGFHGPQWRQAVACRQPAQQAAGQGGQRHVGPQDELKPAHEVGVVNGVECGQHAQRAPAGLGRGQGVLHGLPVCGGQRGLTAIGVHAFAAEQDAVGVAHGHGQAVVAVHHVVQAGGEFGQAGRSAAQLLYQVNLVAQGGLVQLIEVGLHRQHGQPAQAQQHGGRYKGVERGQAGGEGQAGQQAAGGHHGCPGASST